MNKNNFEEAPIPEQILAKALSCILKDGDAVMLEVDQIEFVLICEGELLNVYRFEQIAFENNVKFKDRTVFKFIDSHTSGYFPQTIN
jgi:hypothetical protein